MSGSSAGGFGVTGAGDQKIAGQLAAPIRVRTSAQKGVRNPLQQQQQPPGGRGSGNLGRHSGAFRREFDRSNIGDGFWTRCHKPLPQPAPTDKGSRKRPCYMSTKRFALGEKLAIK